MVVVPRLAIIVLFLSFVRANPETVITSDRSQVLGKSFEYVIVGGGLTGLVTANRLSGNGHTVLVIEAGPDSKNVSAINNAAGVPNITAEECNWKYAAQAENGTQLSVLIDAGRCLGGSTSINGKVWYHPAAPEIDMLEKLGNPGWNSRTLFPKMFETERVIPPTQEQAANGATYAPAFHGTNGEVNVSFPTPLRIPEAQAFYRKGIAETFPGLKPSPDLSLRTSGGSTLANTMWTLWFDAAEGINRRSSAAWAYLYAPSQQRATLTVLTNHYVTKVAFDHNLSATGVFFGNATSGGQEFFVRASKEVLLAGGTLSTPTILERSGIGASRILSKFNIKQIVDLPGVGLNAQDQPGTSLSALLNPANASNPLIVDNVDIFAPIIGLVDYKELFGPNAQAQKTRLLNGIQSRAVAAVAAGVQANVAGAVTIYTAMTDLILNFEIPVVEVIGETFPSVMSAIFWPSGPFHTTSSQIVTNNYHRLLSFSRGHIHINFSDPFARPAIIPRYFTDDFDLDVSVAVAKKSRSMFESPTFPTLIAVPVIDAVPDNSTDAQWAGFVKATSFGASHWLGSCSMLPRKLGGVVDPSLRVYGTQNLRVVDLSVMPFPVSSHTMTLAYAIARRASDLILADA